MNDENRKAAVREELGRADEAQRALLLLKELEPRSHEGVLRLFGLHFVKNGPFEAADSHIVSKMMKLREEADYNPSYTFDSGTRFLRCRKR